MFIEYLISNPVYYFTAVVTLIFSIVLHELAHGWAAIWKGDDTPRVLGHMTPNPITHMGGLGFIAVFLIGLGWGAMPVNPSRFRGRYAGAFVAAAGPAMNLALAIISLTLFALVMKPMAGNDQTEFQENISAACFTFGLFNIVLVLLNLLPVPPLDGSRILADLVPDYQRWLHETQEHHMFMLIGLFVLLSAISNTPYGLFNLAARISLWYVGLLT